MVRPRLVFEVGGWHSGPHLEPDEAEDVKEDKFDFTISLLRVIRAFMRRVFKSHVFLALAPSVLSPSSSTQNLPVLKIILNNQGVLVVLIGIPIPWF